MASSKAGECERSWDAGEGKGAWQSVPSASKKRGWEPQILCLCFVYIFHPKCTHTQMKEQAAFPAKNLKIRNQAKKRIKRQEKKPVLTFLCLSHGA